MPTIRFDDKQLPEIKDWEVGKEYRIVLTVKQIAKRQGEEYPGFNMDGTKKAPDKTISATFKVEDVEVEPEPESDFETEYADKRSGSK